MSAPHGPGIAAGPFRVKTVVASRSLVRFIPGSRHVGEPGFRRDGPIGDTEEETANRVGLRPSSLC